MVYGTGEGLTDSELDALAQACPQEKSTPSPPPTPQEAPAQEQPKPEQKPEEPKDKIKEYMKYYSNWRQEDKEKMVLITKDGRSIVVSSNEKGQVGASLKDVAKKLKETGLTWYDLKEIVHNHNNDEAPSQTDIQVFKAMMGAGFGGDFLVFTPKNGHIQKTPYSNTNQGTVVEAKPLPPADKIPPGAVFIGYDKEGYPKYKLANGKIIRWKE